MAKNLLLVSNTKVHGGKPFEHAKREIQDLFGNIETVTFVPYANPNGMGHEAYRKALAPTFEEMGYQLERVDPQYPVDSIMEARGIFIGGGNTWQLLKELKDRRLIVPIRDRVILGIPYLGSSAGSNVAGLTIGNTNDMAAAEAYGREALALVPFNINPHYQDPVSLTAAEREAVLKIAPQLSILLDHQGETRETRINEYHELGNPEPVVALREGAMIRFNDCGMIRLKGTTGAVIFRRGQHHAHRIDGTLNDLISVDRDIQ